MGNTAEDYFKERFSPVYHEDRHERKIQRFDFYDMVDFADQYAARLSPSEPVKDKPDFEKMARDYASENYSGTVNSDYVMKVAYHTGKALMERIWNDYYLPAQKRIKELESKLSLPSKDAP